MNRSKEERIEEIVRLMRRDDSVDAPVDSIKWAKNLYRTRAADQRPSLVKRLVASLQMDLAPGKAAFGERSAASGTARQMLFNAGENAVDLRVTAKGKFLDLRGQVLGQGFAGGHVAVVGGDIKLETAIDETGEFRLEKVAKGFYELKLTSAEREIVIESLEL